MQIQFPSEESATPLIPLGPAQFVASGIYAFVLDFRRDAWGKVRGVTVSMPEAASMAYYVQE